MTLINALLIIGLFTVAVLVAYLLGRSQAGTPTAAASPDKPDSGKPEGRRLESDMKVPKKRPGQPQVQPPVSSTAADSDASRPAIAGIRNWGYQLQKLNVDHASASPFDLLVIDYSHDGSQERVITPQEMAQLKRKPDGSRRIVLSYVSIGEAEDYRFYWDDAWKRQKPKWLLEENKEWKGNYPVCFWDAGWQSVVCGSNGAYLDRIMALGFDGVYLDKCDVFEDLKEKLPKVAATRPNLEADMVKFISHMSRYLKSLDPNCLVVMQNAETLLEHSDVMRAIDGVAKEELLFGLNGPERPNPPDEVEFSSNLLAKAKAAGKAVMVVEYLNNAAKIEQAATALRGSGNVLYISPKDRDLKKLNYDAPLIA